MINGFTLSLRPPRLSQPEYGRLPPVNRIQPVQYIQDRLAWGQASDSKGIPRKCSEHYDLESTGSSGAQTGLRHRSRQRWISHTGEVVVPDLVDYRPQHQVTQLLDIATVHS